MTMAGIAAERRAASPNGPSETTVVEHPPSPSWQVGADSILKPAMDFDHSLRDLVLPTMEPTVERRTSITNIVARQQQTCRRSDGGVRLQSCKNARPSAAAAQRISLNECGRQTLLDHAMGINQRGTHRTPDGDAE